MSEGKGLVRSLDVLDPRFFPLAKKYLAALDAAFIKYFVIETLRYQSVQTAYYYQSRFPLDIVNQKRLDAGLPPIDAKQNRDRITDSELTVFKGVGHGNGTAMDVVPVDRHGNLLWMRAPRELLFEMGEIAELSGLEWGGRFKPLDRYGMGWDPFHVQMRRNA